MNSSISRRLFIEGCAATLGLTLVGCSSGSGGPLVAVAGENGSFVLANAPEVEMNEAIPFEFSGGGVDKKPGLIINSVMGLAAVNAVCTHSGCTVVWTNDVKQPLHCPCHNSNFTVGGEVISGPAKKPLPKFSVKKDGTNLVLTPA